LKQAFQWSPEADQAFQALKKDMLTTPMLVLPRFDELFVVETDACDDGIGAVLMQCDRPVAYLSKALGAKNKMLSIYENSFWL
jgi:hypothetical protein